MNFLIAISTWGIIGIVAGVLVAALAVLYFVGKKLQKRQNETEAQIAAMKQTQSILVIDKKMMRASESGLPEAAIAQIPWYAKRAKMPIVKAKIGPQVMSLMADKEVFDILPVKKECRVELSGIYISGIKSVRGGKVPEKPAKQTLGQKIRARLQNSAQKKGAPAGSSGKAAPAKASGKNAKNAAPAGSISRNARGKTK